MFIYFRSASEMNIFTAKSKKTNNKKKKKNRTSRWQLSDVVHLLTAQKWSKPECVSMHVQRCSINTTDTEHKSSFWREVAEIPLNLYKSINQVELQSSTVQYSPGVSNSSPQGPQGPLSCISYLFLCFSTPDIWIRYVVARNLIRSWFGFGFGTKLNWIDNSPRGMQFETPFYCKEAWHPSTRVQK